MKVQLLHPDRDTVLLHDDRGHVRLVTERSANGSDLIQDLQLEPLFAAMAGEEDLPGRVARTMVLTAAPAPDVVVFRQQVLADCLNHPELLDRLYQLACDAVADKKKVYRSVLRERSEARLNGAAQLLRLLVDRLRQLRRICTQATWTSPSSAQGTPPLSSPGFSGFFERVRAELDDAYLDELSALVKGLGFRGGILMSGGLGEGSQGSEYLLRAPDPARRGLLRRVPLDGKTHSFTIAPRDDAGATALGELRDMVLASVSRAANEAVDHVMTFFETLQHELAFYRGCVRLHQALAQRGCSLTMPVPGQLRVTDPDRARGQQKGVAWHAAGLVDPVLALSQPLPLVGNSFDADDKTIIVITGANGGGKSTFLRAVGVATLMMRAGMFVAAAEYVGPLFTDVYTHFRREEDQTMEKGKFDEELSRMSDIARRVGPRDVVLCNESFSATNEREGSQIGVDVFTAMTDCGVRIVLVTHMFELAETLRRDRGDTSVFLRAARGPDGRRTFWIRLGSPLATSHARDLFDLLVPASTRDREQRGPGSRIEVSAPRSRPADGSAARSGPW